MADNMRPKRVGLQAARTSSVAFATLPSAFLLSVPCPPPPPREQQIRSDESVFLERRQKGRMNYEYQS